MLLRTKGLFFYETRQNIFSLLGGKKIEFEFSYKIPKNLTTWFIDVPIVFLCLYCRKPKPNLPIKKWYLIRTNKCILFYFAAALLSISQEYVQILTRPLVLAKYFEFYKTTYFSRDHLVGDFN